MNDKGQKWVYIDWKVDAPKVKERRVSGEVQSPRQLTGPYDPFHANAVLIAALRHCRRLVA